MDVYEQLETELVIVATTMIGIKEEGWNSGPMIEEFQKAVDGVASGEPYCMGFVQWCIIQAEMRIATTATQRFHMSELFKSEHCMTVWNKSHQALEINHPRPGCLIFWQKWKNGKATHQGHVGIVAKVLDENTVLTVEGNTGSKDQREGEGVYSKSRHIRHAIGSLRPKGFLQVW